jgi:hypothetical protein
VSANEDYFEGATVRGSVVVREEPLQIARRAHRDDAVEHERVAREPDAAVPVSFNVLTARETCELEDPPASDELLGGLVVRGQRIVLGAHTGEGKTTMGLQIIRAIVNAETFLDWAGPGAGARALVVDAEQGLRTVKRRLREARLDKSDSVDYLRVPDGLNLDHDTEQALGLQRLLEEGGYAVVVLDPLYKLHSGDSNAERAAVDLMRVFDAWRDRYRFALLLPVHLRKPIPGERFSIHDVFGSSAYVRGAEVVLGIRRVSNGYAELHFFKDRDGDLEVGDKWGLLFNREDGYRRAPDDEDDEAVMVERLIEYVGANPGQSTTRVTTAVEGRKATLSNILETDDRFRVELRGQSKRWHLTSSTNPFPGDGNGWERVTPATVDQPVPEVAPLFRGAPVGTGETTAVPDQPDRVDAEVGE